jgi:eukaryotic-like serine/threonine-protein kinase
MIVVPPHDVELDSLMGSSMGSSQRGQTVYWLDSKLGAGGMSVACLALMRSPGGESPVVIKFMKPEFVRRSEQTAVLAIRKEASALHRLNQRVPPCPFVVRMVDAGNLSVFWKNEPLELPWLALEYIHGGHEGTTLFERVSHCLRSTGFAFEMGRTARTVECLSDGLSVIHEVEVIHRDIKPENVLCCGFGENEIFKISDFGIARPSGIASTFGGFIVGTAGYAAPEQVGLLAENIGPWTDVFGMAAVIYFMLTGEHYFIFDEFEEALRLVSRPERRSICDSVKLAPELRRLAENCRAIDGILAQATAAKKEERPQTARALANLLLPWLRGDSSRFRPSFQRVSSFAESETTVAWQSKQWAIRHHTGEERTIRSVAWTGDSTCLAVTTTGLEFWNGTEWLAVNTHSIYNPQGFRFVRQISPGRWMLGGEEARVAIYTRNGIGEVIQGPDRSVVLTDASGDLKDLGVIVASKLNHPPSLHAIVGKRWLRPLPLPELKFIAAIARVADEQWLVAGRRENGYGFAGLYEPLQWQVTPLDTYSTTSFLVAAAHEHSAVGVVGGTNGTVIWIEQQKAKYEKIDTDLSLSAATVDLAGRAWAAGRGAIWFRHGGKWSSVWSNPHWNAPFISLNSNMGTLTAVAVDGAVLEGRTQLIGATLPTLLK